MSKFTLILNSHSLTYFQQCEELYKFKALLSIRPSAEKKALLKGSLISRMLANYYYRKMKGKNILVPLNPFMTVNLAQKLLKFSFEEAKEFAVVMMAYHKEYKDKDWKDILAVERGFSKLLYEDENNLFVYEGRPDLICKGRNQKIGIDHKHQSMKYSIYEHNNQAIGYCWGLELDHFIYNYIKFTKDDWFRRTVHKFTPSQIDQWKNDTIEWFFRIKRSISNRSFIRNRSACQSKFGICEYHEICEQPSQVAKDWIIKSKFVQLKQYRSW